MSNQIMRDNLRRVILRFPAVVKFLSPEAIKALTNYESVRKDYWEAVSDAVERYLTGNSPITKFKNEMYRAMNSAFQTAAEIGYTDGGGEVPLDPETQSWIDGQIDNEKSNINSLFQNLKENWEKMEASTEAMRRADGYASALDSIYTQGKMFGAGNPMLTWHLGNTEEHCDTCQKLDGGRHKASWYIERDYIPKKPNALMDCHGYNCDCWFTDDDGNEYWM